MKGQPNNKPRIQPVVGKRDGMMKKTLPKRNVPIKRNPLRPAGRKYA